MKNAYLIANYFMVPGENINTSKKDWQKSPSATRWNEQITFARNLKDMCLFCQVCSGDDGHDETLFRT